LGGMRPQVYRKKQAQDQVRLTAGTILLVIVLLLVAGLYLAVSTKAARIGREVFRLEAEFDESQRRYNELLVRFSESTSPEKLWDRAQALGYTPAQTDDLTYLVVTDLQVKDEFIAPAPLMISSSDQASIAPAYSESLVDWFGRWLGLGAR